MNNAYKVRNGLEQVGTKVYLCDGNWISIPFYAVLSPRWNNDKSNFEPAQTEIGRVSADYYTYIGPFNHNILSLSEKAWLTADGVKYVFRKKDAVKMGDKVLYYKAVLRKVWDESD